MNQRGKIILKEKKDKRKMAEEKFFVLVSRYFVKYHVPNPLALPGAILAIWCWTNHKKQSKMLFPAMNARKKAKSWSYTQPKLPLCNDIWRRLTLSSIQLKEMLLLWIKKKVMMLCWNGYYENRYLLNLILNPDFEFFVSMISSYEVNLFFKMIKYLFKN